MTSKKSPVRDSKGRYISNKTSTPKKVKKAKAVTAIVAAPTKKNYIGISRDHSGSMSSIARPAARDYNSTITAIQAASVAEKQDTIVSVVKHSGYGVERETVNSTVAKLVPLNEGSYNTYGGTPLFSSVLDLIDQFEAAPDAKDPNVSFLIMAVTDGGDNASGHDAARRLNERMRKLTATDRWSFTFRVPRGYASELTRFGIPAGNILEWDQTEQGVEVATKATTDAFRSFYTARSAGQTMTKSFYQTDMTNVSKATIKAKLVDISGNVQFFDVKKEEQIRTFIEAKTNKTLVKGQAFYQLTKKEDEVQDYKQIAIRDKKTTKVYSGVQARNILGLPHNGTVKVAPGNHGGYDIFIQSTSVNRKLIPGTAVLYWETAGN